MAEPNQDQIVQDALAGKVEGIDIPDRHIEESGDMFVVNRLLGNPGALQAGQLREYHICLSPGEEITDVVIAFLDRTDLTPTSQIIEE